jgi:NADH dehydrogenase (ubiquinone) 1 alpha subcomplex subunit 5
VSGVQVVFLDAEFSTFLIRHHYLKLARSDPKLQTSHVVQNNINITIHYTPLILLTMRRTLTRLAAIKPATFLEPGAPTGLTGLRTHPSPRSTLLYIYSNTLDKLKAFPESSLYRQSTEAITKHRMGLIESIKPAGYEEWSAKAKATLQEHPEVFETKEGTVAHDEGRHTKEVIGGKVFITTKAEKEYDELAVEWDGELDSGGELEGTRTTAERKGQAAMGKERPGTDTKTVAWDPEPPLSAEQ